MAIALDNSGQGSSAAQAAGVAFTFSYTVNSNVNGILILAIQTGDNAGSNHQQPSAVSYNGSAMTFISGASQAVGANQCATSMWYLLAPSTGSNTVSITVPSTGSGSGASRIIAYPASYTGAKQTGQPDSSSTNSAGSGTSFTSTTTTVADNCWTLALFFSNQAASPTAGTGTTLRQSSNTIGSGTMYGDSNAVVHPAGSNSMSANGNSGLWTGAIISIAPAPASLPLLPVNINQSVKRSNYF